MDETKDITLDEKIDTMVKHLDHITQNPTVLTQLMHDMADTQLQPDIRNR